MITPSKPSPWIRPGWYVALCLTDGMTVPHAWQDERKRDAWVRTHALAFPDHEVHQGHGEAA